jgi:hypothetical protein
VRHLDESLRSVEQMPVHRSRIVQMLAQALLRRNAAGDLERARDALRECLTLLDRMGDARKAEGVRRELGSLS